MQTAPPFESTSPLLFTVVTGQQFETRDDLVNGHTVFPRMAALDPDFYVHTGDAVYYDKEGPFVSSIDEARYKWNRIFSLPFQRDFHRNHPAYLMKDDHDTWQNNCWPSLQNNVMGDFTFQQGQAVFLEQVPMGEKTYRTIRWGKDLQIWLVEGRDFRDPNSSPDNPAKTLWGQEQLNWFQQSVEGSDATFRILISPGPIVGPEPSNKDDNHATGAFATEGGFLREFLSNQEGMIVICGDKHYQYVSIDSETGLWEAGCGATTDEHASGLNDQELIDRHRYYNVIGGFLSVRIERAGGTATLTLRHHNVEGLVMNEEVFSLIEKRSVIRLR